MKRYLQALAIAALVIQATVTVKPDPVVPGNYRVYDSKGNFKETIKPDPVVPGQYRIEDKDGKPAGFIKPDPLVPDGKKLNLYEKPK
jgi:hypothetical protein